MASQSYCNHHLCHISPLSFAWAFTITQILMTGIKPAALTHTEEEYLTVGHKWQCNRSGLNSKGYQKKRHTPSAPKQEHPLQGKALLVPTALVLPAYALLPDSRTHDCGWSDGWGRSLSLIVSLSGFRKLMEIAQQYQLPCRIYFATRASMPHL